MSTSEAELRMLENSGALIMAGQVLLDHPDIRIRLARVSGEGFSVEIANAEETFVCETRLFLGQALLAALARYADEWVHR